MQEFFKIARIILVGFVFVFFASSCLDQEINGYEEEAEQKLKSFISSNGYTPDENIGYGIYVKEIVSSDDTTKPRIGNTVLLKYTGMYTDGVTVFETTDEDQSAGLPYAAYHIYGSKRHTVGSMIVGFDTAIRTITKGTVAQFVIPHQYAYGNYEPVVYDVELLDVIADDSTYEADLFNEFVEANGFVDSIAPGLYCKFAGEDTINPDPNVKYKDTIQMKLYGYYAEVYEDGPGRQFYPREGTNEYEVFDSTYLWGATTEYPLDLSAIDSAIKYMVEGQTLEIAFKSGAEAASGYQWGYSTAGKIDPYLNFFIVSPYTPLHYKIEFINNKNR